MLGVLKAVLGVVSAGTGVIAPIAVNKLSNVVPVKVKESFKNSFAVAEKQVNTNRENLKIQKAFKDLHNKDCKLVKNVENDNNWFNAVYACKGEVKDKFDFYYLGSRESFSNKDESHIAQKILNVNYERGDDKADWLLLKLIDNKEIKWKISLQDKGGWSHFKNVNIGEQCQVSAYGSGESVLNCQLKNSEETTSTFSYSFAIF